jgi:nicotinamidase-related amidase
MSDSDSVTAVSAGGTDVGRPLGSFTEQVIAAEAARQYEQGVAAMEVTPGRTALVIVDMIDEFVRPNWSPYWIPEATAQVPVIRAVSQAFRQAGAPVIYLAYEVGLRGLNFPVTEMRVPIGEPAAEYMDQLLQKVAIYEELAPEPDDLVVLKHCYSGFHETPLESVLKSLDVTTIVIAGTMTNFCCGATAREAFWRGFDVVFGSDINSTDDPGLHDAEIRTLRRGYARIATAAEIIASISGRPARTDTAVAQA